MQIMNIIKIRLLSTFFCILFFSQTYATERNQTLEEYRIKIICRTAEYIYKYNDENLKTDDYFNCENLNDILAVVNSLKLSGNKSFIKAIIEQREFNGFSFVIHENNTHAIRRLKENILSSLLSRKPERKEETEFNKLEAGLKTIADDFQTQINRIEQQAKEERERKQAAMADAQTRTKASSYNLLLYIIMFIIVIIIAIAIYFFVFRKKPRRKKKRNENSSNNIMHDTPPIEHFYNTQPTSQTTDIYNIEQEIINLKNTIGELREQIKKLTEELRSNQATNIESIKNLAESLNHQDPPKKKNSAMPVKTQTQPTTKVPEQKPKPKVYAYAPNPNAGLFNELRNDDIGNPTYIITIDNHNTASFEITNNDVAQQKAINGSSTFLQPACEYNNDINDGNKIRTLQKGKLTKQGNHWKIDKKALIEFYD